MKVNYKLKRFIVSFKKKFRKKEPEMGQIQKKCYDIVIKLIKSSDSKVFKSPHSFKKFIENGDILVTIDRGSLHVVNGVYHYDIFITDKMYDYMSTKINNSIERKCTIFEKKVNDRINDRLDGILTNMTK